MQFKSALVMKVQILFTEAATQRLATRPDSTLIRLLNRLRVNSDVDLGMLRKFGIVQAETLDDFNLEQVTKKAYIEHVNAPKTRHI